jgi:hypothetical protein
MEAANRYRLKPHTTLQKLIDQPVDDCLEPYSDLVKASIKMAPNPFAKGAMKATFHGFDCVAKKTVVFKQSMAEKKSHQTLAKCEAFLACHHAAAYLAQEFNSATPAICQSVKFVEASVIHLRERPDRQFFIQEEPLETESFEKFNSNAGYCQPSPTPKHGTEHSAVQAFSHWTHHVTDGALMVVDCQGVYCAATRTFKLTDPAIHSTALTRFGSTNMGEMGFTRFYKTHVCNQHCRALGLPAKLN